MTYKYYAQHLRTILFREIDNIIKEPELCVFRPGCDFTRKRKLSLQTMFHMIIGIGGGSLSKELYGWSKFSSNTATTSAFVQQRGKIKPEAMEILFHRFVKATQSQMKFQGYRLLAVDGSDLRLPANVNDSFSSIQNTENGKNYNLAHLDALYDLRSKTYIDASIQSKKGMSEHQAFVSMVDRSDIAGKVIIIADRGYESYNNMAHCQEKGWNFIIRAKESYGIISKLRLPAANTFDKKIILTFTRRQTKETKRLLQDQPERYRWIQPHSVFDYIQPKESTMYDLHFRVVRFKIPGGGYETVYTNLSAEDVSPEMLKQLYHQRWGIETSFKELKYGVGLASIHSKKKEFMLQEVFARLILYNFASFLMYHAEICRQKNCRPNFTVGLYICREYFKKNVSADTILEILKKFIFSIRPGRKYPRYVNILSAVSFQYRIP